MQIIELNHSHSAEYKAFFHRGLKEDAASFRISLADDADLIFPTKGKEDSFTLAAVSDSGDLLGVVSFVREGHDREKLRHKGLLFRMYVSRENSGKGIGGHLIQAVLDRAKKLPNMEQINLTVIASNKGAKHLYQKFGFQTFSLEKNAVKYEGKYFDEETIVLIF